MDPKYPDIKVELTGKNGNAFVIMGHCATAARLGDVSEEEIERYTEESMAGDYNHLLRTAMKWFTIC